MVSTASVAPPGLGNVRKARAIRKNPRTSGRSKALKGESQERPDQKWLGGSKGSKASREVRTLKTQRAGAWELRGIRLLRVGDRCRELKLQERDSVVFIGGHADAYDAGVNSGETLRKSASPRVDGLGILKRVPSARRGRTLQEP